MLNKKQERLQSNIRKMSLKICISGRIITRQLGYPRSVLKKQREMIKVISTSSAWMDAWMEVKPVSSTALSNKKVSKELLLQRKVIKWWSQLLNKKDDFSLSKSQRSLFIKYAKAACCIFRPVFGCCAPQLLVEIVIVSIFYAKKQKA